MTLLSNSPLASAIPGLAELWSQTLGDPRISIAILDGPVDRAHPCFHGARLQSLPTFVPEIVSDGRMCRHATHIASTIFGQPGTAVQGVAPGVTGLMVPIFSDANAGQTSQVDLARAIKQAAQAGAQVINISGGELSNSGAADPILLSAVRACENDGILIIAAAGNDSCQCLHVPAALPSVLAVGAMDDRGMPLESSNWGQRYRTQGILAPGQNIVGAAIGGGTATKTGTSFATPLVTGVVALLLSLQLAQGDRPNSQAIRDAILATATACDNQIFSDCQRFLAGRLNLPAAHALISNRRRIAMSAQSAVQENLDANPVNHQTLEDASHVVACELNESTPHVGLEPSTAAPSALPAPGASAESDPAVVARAAVLERPALMNAPGAARTRRSVAAAPSRSSLQPSGVVPNCECEAKGSKSLVFAIGSLGYDFGTEARRDSFRLAMPNYYAPEVGADSIPYVHYRGGPAPEKSYPPNPYDARQLVQYLGGYPPPKPPFPSEGGFPRKADDPAFPSVPKAPEGYPNYSAHLADAADLIWILNIELTPIYAIRPSGSFATECYQRLVEFLAGQVRHPEDSEYVSRVSIPGVLTNETVQLYSGQVVPVLVPNLRAMYAWSVNPLIESAIDQFKAKRARDLKDEKDEAKRKKIETDSDPDKVAENLQNFLDRIYYDLRNLGQTSAERAMNFSATNAFQAAAIFADQASHMQLDHIVTERSAFCRKDSDCWDVKLRFFDPENVLRARRVSRFTVDVSDAIPVLVGPVRTWSESG